VSQVRIVERKTPFSQGSWHDRRVDFALLHRMPQSSLKVRFVAKRQNWHPSFKINIFMPHASVYHTFLRLKRLQRPLASTSTQLKQGVNERVLDFGCRHARPSQLAGKGLLDAALRGLLSPTLSSKGGEGEDKFS
jgi:hypothetical protein